MTKGIFLTFSALMALSFHANGQAVLNAEKLSPQRKEPFQFHFTGSLDAASGNTNFINVETTGAIGYKKGPHWIRLLGGNTFLSEESNELENSSFGHLRYNFFLSKRLSTFHFFQVQRNANLILNLRQLTGTGLRYDIIPRDTGFSLAFGTGIMYEDEQLKAGKIKPGNQQRTQFFRSTSLLVTAYQVNDQLTLKNISYFQPRLKWLYDFRILNELIFTLAVNEHIVLEPTFEWRYDNHPPGKLERNDYGVVMELSLDF